MTSSNQLPDYSQLVAHHHASQASLDEFRKLFVLWTKSSSTRRKTTEEDYWKILQAFATTCEFKSLSNISRKDVVNFRDHLLELGQSSITANRKIGILKALFNTALNYELIESNPADNVRTPTMHQSKQRVAFSTDDLARIFHSPIYTKAYPTKSGSNDAAYWLPLLALFTGARVEELAQLLIKDVHYIEGLGHYLNITDEAEHSHLKNAASRRRIPIHPALIACGFIEYISSISQSKFIFPNLKANPRGKMGGYFSNYFSGYLRKKVGIVDKRKVFHSFRHTFKEICRTVGIEEPLHDAITGHTAPSAGRRYGNEQYPLAPLFQAIKQYQIAGLDLTHLYRKPISVALLSSEVKLISAYYGVVVAFAATQAKNINSPFIVALHDGAETRIDIATNKVIYGQIPHHKQLLVNAWVEIHREELIASWNTGKLTGEYLKLDPLR